MTHSTIAPRTPRMNFHALLPGQRVCQKCKRYVYAKGGKYETLDRLHQRWVCADCATREEVPPMHPMFAQMLGYAPAISVTPPKSCVRKHVLSDDACDVWIATPTINKILASMHGEMCSKEITEASGMLHKTVLRAIKQMLESGQIRFVKHSKYFGRQFARVEEA